jgi:hypothetical protein
MNENGTYTSATDCSVSLSDVIYIINEWKYNHADLRDVVDTINAWKSKDNCCMRNYDDNKDFFIQKDELIGSLFDYAASRRCELGKGPCNQTFITTEVCVKRVMLHYKAYERQRGEN